MSNLNFRLGLIDDLFSMVKAGHTSTAEVLKFLRAFEDETDYNVWSSISNILSRLSQLLGNTPYREGYERVCFFSLLKIINYIKLYFF